MWSSDLQSGSLARGAGLPAFLSRWAASVPSPALFLRAEIGLRDGEAIEGVERTIRPADGWLAAPAALAEVEAWFLRRLAYQTVGFVTIACLRTGRVAPPRLAIRLESGHPFVVPESALQAEVERLRVMANQFGFRFANLDTIEIPMSVIELVPERLARENVCLPVEFENGRLIVAVTDPMNFELVEKLRFILNREVDFAMAPREQILAALDRYYGEESPGRETAETAPTPEKRRRNMLDQLSQFFLAVRSMTGDAEPTDGDPAPCDWARITFTWID